MNKKYNTLKTIGPQAARFIAALYEGGRTVFHIKDVRQILGTSAPTATSFVRKLVNRGIVARLKPGLFILIPMELVKETDYIGNPLVIAREIVGGEEYYISHATAMEVHGMTTQPQMVVYTTTIRQFAAVKSHGMEFRFVKADKRFFFGWTEHWVTKQEKVKVSDLEKTLIDGLKQPEYCGGISEVAKAFWIKRKDIDVRRLCRYAVKLGVGAVARRAGYLMEFYGIASEDELAPLRQMLTETYVKLDPCLPDDGKYSRRWRLFVNISDEELISLGRT